MAYWWITERMGEEHRRDLFTERPESRWPTGPGDDAIGAALQGLEHQPRPVVSERRHPIGHHVGTLLIRAGVRLGGAHMELS